MGRRLRFIPPGGALVEVTSRTIQSRFLLRPSAGLREITLGVLGRAQRRYEVAIVAFVFLSNHYHLLVWVRDAEQLARFVGFLNSNLAREIGRLHGWREKVWGRRYQPVLVSDEPAAQIERVHYLFRQGIKEGLVSDPLEWPGATSLPAMLDGRSLTGTWFDRTAECLARRREAGPCRQRFVSKEVVRLSPLPAWAHLAEGERRRRLEDLLELTRSEAASRIQSTGRKAVGPEGVERLDPWDIPAETRRGPAPLVHAASGEARAAIRAAYRCFVSTYRRAADLLRSIGSAPIFPVGSFPPARPFVRPAPA